MEWYLIVIFTVLGAGLFFNFFMMIRNEWIYQNRIKCIDNDYDKYNKLPSYRFMMWHFLCWDIDKFIRDK